MNEGSITEMSKAEYKLKVKTKIKEYVFSQLKIKQEMSLKNKTYQLFKFQDPRVFKEPPDKQS